MLSYIIPAYNEEKTLAEIVSRVRALDADKEIIIVDDGSEDRTPEIAGQLAREHPEVVFRFHRTNRGKGAAIHTAIPLIRGDFAVIQDADLEYYPADTLRLYRTARKGHPVVYGSRNLAAGEDREVSSLSFYLGGLFLSAFANFLYKSRLTDINTCYKLFETGLLRSLCLREEGFEFCEEITARILRKKIEIIEIPVRYTPRRFSQGKKIKWTDGLVAARTLVKYKLM